MRFKSLLLGSAAALAASSAYAADPADAMIIAGPEPVEYVRVCDAYGVGFFYIPGTETCLRIGGEIRFQLGATDDEGVYTDNVDDIIYGHTPNYHGYTEGGWNTKTRARIFFDVRSDTEWGTLQGYARLQFDRDTGIAGESNSAVANHAWLSLGGLRMGWSDSAFDATPNSGVASFGSHSDDGLYYSAGQRNFIQYNFSGGNGVFATVSLEDDDASDYSYTDMVTLAYDGGNYIPDVVVRAGVSQGWGAIWGAVGWDEDRTDLGSVYYDWFYWMPFTQMGESGWGAVVGTQINVPNMAGSSLRVLGFYADSDNSYNPHGGQWSVLASYGHQFNDQWFASVGAQYTDSLYIPGTDVKTGADRLDIELYATWMPVENFQIMTEIVYSKASSDMTYWNAIAAPNLDDEYNVDIDGSLSGFIRFSRFF